MNFVIPTTAALLAVRMVRMTRDNTLGPTILAAFFGYYLGDQLYEALSDDDDAVPTTVVTNPSTPWETMPRR